MQGIKRTAPSAAAGCLISAVSLLKGACQCVSLEVMEGHGITGPDAAVPFRPMLGIAPANLHTTAAIHLLGLACRS